MDLTQITRQGERSYYRDQGIYKNPYPAGCAEFNAFERGWMQSLKKDDGKLAGRSQQASAFRDEKPAPPYDLEKESQRYRNRKG